ncbi:probable galacturonosyltransferase 4 isoform X1 [Solanum dulcamara]|uniref:probable galacturonosyltransferase 4 isoform X1 n=1 Tax=Solanum dulcamara TaxID=45834 RepID=UPI0024868183|nr:probable galacturonosyltransferase 4 isoform X1 [Solanum dulcamara]XP_055800757.1 probable galacturonosyltransferase 4 isoform X1 [Solanum dulcamara]XP_055800758.1 probable galacturonosyltransferase 4 isoform X1 [Solanum dulcamara]XP_055800759.1 probable galacturonosyltransferase 4 isoform X1 [Solanum dulcamara]XP_055800760.1 probable galacturonosyltransferase 4 isoform X1 [Solanum dulcamara]XP_055800761.1 probable galacturonosyltransferase 4 isoform X1 [Solanum dulcamara]
MKMKLRKPVLFLLLVTVLAPIVLYTDTLGTYFNSPSSSRTEFIEDLSTFTFGGDVRPLNVLPQESSTSLKEPRGDVYSENSSHSLSNASDTLSSEDARKTRQLTEAESMKHQTATGSSNDGVEVATNGSHISQVTDNLHEPQKTDKTSPKLVSAGKNESRVMETSSKKKTSPTDSNHTLDSTSTKNEIRHDQNTVKTSGGVAGETARGKDEDRNAQIVPSDARVRQLKDQLIRAKVYLSLSATRNNPHFIRELRLRMKEVLRALGEATKDSDLSRSANEKLKAMEQTLAKGKQIQDDCATIVKKLRAMLHSAEEQLRVHKKQTLYLTHLTAKTLPKGLHCLPLRLSTEYFKLNSSQQHFPHQENLENPKLYHYALFSDNILAAAVVINSTVSHAKDPSKHVFHIVTDRLNFAAMRMWFLANPPQYATVDVQNVEEFTWLNSSYSPVLKQLNSQSMIDYYFRSRADSDPNVKFRNPKYLSIMNHLRFYLPEIFPKLDKVLFLDDDIVVQKDLSGLWSLDLKGKVIGVVETCGESFHRFDRYLNFSNPLISKNFDPRACGWAFGMNIIDLNEWRRQNITEVYHSWQNLNHERLLWKLGTLPPGLITFWKRTYALDRSWHVLGLGYNPNVSQKDIQRAAVIHYNGNLKPWLEISIPKFRDYWSKFVDYDQVFLRECNINKLGGS